MLKLLEVNFHSVNVLEDQNIREGIKAFSDWPTIPQLYIQKEFVGGCDIVKEMYESGELAKLFEDKGISFKAKN
jgi:monothiol glutaredoxin